jgi:surfeit locus 1 family protein
MALLTVVGVALFVALGRWQWHRAVYKRALADEFARGAALRVDLGARSTAALARYSEVRVSGRYQPERQFLLDNLSYSGRPGYQVLTPLTLDDGRTLLVNRGWVPFTGSRQRLPDIGFGAPPQVRVSGRLDALPVTGISLGHAPPSGTDWPRLASFPTMDELAGALGRPLEPRQLLLDANEPHGYVRDWHPAGLGPERHISYAVQWWGMAALAAGLFVVLNLERRAP